jgi:uroporphyrinogen decarboxylase
MKEMTSRQRVVTALDHQEPDRVPFDCTFTYDAYREIEKALGFSHNPDLRTGSPALNVTPPVEFLREMNVDLYYLGLNSWKNAPVFEYGMETYEDIWGVGYKKIKSDTGLEYPSVIHPLSKATKKDLEKYPWPDPSSPELTAGLQERAAFMYEETNFALVGKFSTSIFEQAASLRGMEQLYLDFIQDPEFVGELFDRLTEIAIRLIETGLKASGQYLQILRLAGDDMGSQRGMLFSPAMFRRMIKPHFARLYSQAKSLFQDYNPQGKLMGHTDGDVYPIIPDYIEMGLDVLNPVQPYVAEMEHERLKREFGDRLSFHGGIDLQQVLPFGTPEEVKLEAINMMRKLGPCGGYILAPTHYLLPDVPPENIIALRDAVKRHGGYPLVYD